MLSMSTGTELVSVVTFYKALYIQVLSDKYCSLQFYFLVYNHLRY